MTGYDIPYSFDDRYYIRSMSSNESTGPEVVVKLVMSRGIDPLRGQPSDVQDLTFDMLYAMMVSHGLHPRGDEGFYRSHGMLDEKGRFNLTAYLVSDQNSVPMQVVRFNGTDRASMSTRCDFGGRSIIATVTAVLDHISSYMVTSVDLSEGVRRETDLFDFESFREAWINACVHNAWRAMVPPSVMVFDDRIEVVSYGTVPFPMSLEDFYRGDSHPVDVSLFELFTLVGLTGQSGHGVPTIVARYGREAFLITESSVIVTLPFAFEPDYVKARRESERRRSGLDPDRAGILTYLESHPEAKLSEVSEHTGMSLSSVKNRNSELCGNWLRGLGTVWS